MGAVAPPGAVVVEETLVGRVRESEEGDDMAPASLLAS